MADGHDDVGGAGELVGPRSSDLAGDVDTSFGHRGDGCWAGPIGRFGAPGFGLYQALTAAGVRCAVVAPSKLHWRRGRRALARLLRLDEITLVAIPILDQEAAHDLVRAREDCRGDLMRARCRLSKLLLRHEIVYYGGNVVCISV